MACLRGSREGTLPAPGDRHGHVAGAAEQPVVIEAALPAAVGHRDDVIGFPPGLGRPPQLSALAVRSRRFRLPPFLLGCANIEAAQAALPLVALLHFLADVRRTASNPPFVHARVAAEGAPRGLDWPAAPAANRVTGLVSNGLAPLLGRHGPASHGAHICAYRPQDAISVGKLTHNFPVPRSRAVPDRIRQACVAAGAASVSGLADGPAAVASWEWGGLWFAPAAVARTHSSR